jgi:tRNA pseudouridine32 synthase/23S rRNA pseudouridine746 synthase
MTSPPKIAPSRVWLPDGPWPTLGAFLATRFAAISPQDWASRAQRQLLRYDDGQLATLEACYRPRHHLFYYREVAGEPVVPFATHIVFEDELIVVADKPHFLPVTPAGSFVNNTLQSQLQAQFNCHDLQALHRLDRETAGLVVLAKHVAHRGAYHQMFAEHRIEKTYLAIAGKAPASLVLPHHHTSRMVSSGQFFLQTEEPGLANSMTLIALEHPLDGQRALYRLKPITGRKHQLRVHMASLGLPIEGDRFYPTPRLQNLNDFSDPLQLLAQGLAFTDPVTGQARQFFSTRTLQGVSLAPAQSS